jgi:hypothetical protein
MAMQRVCRSQVSLLGQDDQKSGRLAIGRGRPQFGRDLFWLRCGRTGHAAQGHTHRNNYRQ